MSRKAEIILRFARVTLIVGCVFLTGYLVGQRNTREACRKEQNDFIRTVETYKRALEK